MDALATPFRLPLIAILRGITPDETLDHVRARVEEGFDAVEVERRLRPQDAAQAGGNADAHMKIGKGVGFCEREGVVEQMEAFSDLGQRGVDAEHEGSGLQAQAVSAQTARELIVSQVAK